MDVEKIKVYMRTGRGARTYSASLAIFPCEAGQTDRILSARGCERKQNHRSSWVPLRHPCFLLYPVSTEPHLHGLLQDVGLEAMEDVDGPSVTVLQRGPHHHVIVGILVEVLNGGNA